MKRLSTRLLKILIVPVLILALAAVAQADSAPTATGPGGDGGHPILNTSRVTPPIATSVLVLAADDVTLIMGELSALGIPAVNYFDARSVTPTLAQLTPYDAIVFVTNFVPADPVALGDVVADYVDAGGGVVMGVFSWFGSPFGVEGRILSPNYSPFEQVGPSLYTTSCIARPVHQFPPLLQFVHNACDGFRDDVIVEPGALELAQWLDGSPFVAINHDGNVVGINSYPGDQRQLTGEIPQIFYNAANYVAQ